MKSQAQCRGQFYIVNIFFFFLKKRENQNKYPQMSCTTVQSVSFRGMCTLPQEILYSFKKNTADLLNGYVLIIVHKIKFSHGIVIMPSL